MNDHPRAEDPDPLRTGRTGALYVPVRCGHPADRIRLFRTPLGARTAVAFTSAPRLTRTLGRRQDWTRLSEAALRSLLAPLDGVGLVVDPPLAAPAPAGTPAARPARGPHGPAPVRVPAAPPLVPAPSA
ncbi:SAV_915 family protein [Streptomyces sp. NPDC001515]